MEQQTMKNKKFLITGGSGFIGSRLIPKLLATGNEITLLSRSPIQTAQKFNQAVKVIDQLHKLEGNANFDIVINLAGQGIADKRWTDKVKQQLRDSRLKITDSLVSCLARLEQKPECMISGSAIGFYGARNDEIIDESFHQDNDHNFSQQLCMDWEREASHAETLGIRTCYLRTGIVLGSGGGALAKMLPPFKMGLGGPIGDGHQWMSWVHIDDLVGIMLYAMQHKDIRGPLNGTAPNPVTNKEFSTKLGQKLNRPAFLPLPMFAVSLLMGQMGKELLSSGQRVIPKNIMDAGYVFQFKHLESALSDVIA
jgi:uncharacterized protein (TIGR01777 family)